jgi:hypothetical protein
LGSNTIVLQGKDALNNLSNQGSFTLNRHKPADATGDGASNMPDFMAFLSAYGNISSKGQTINDGNNYLADFNESGVIDMNDFLNLLANWTHS